MRITRKLGAAALAVAATTTTLVAAAGPADAATTATPNCTKVKSAYVGNGWYANTPGYDAASGSHFNCYLELGDNNAAVRWLQYTIAYCYDDGGIVVDGKYGTQTRDRVRTIQKLGGVSQTGIYGPLTRKSMSWRLYSPKLGRYSDGCYKP